MATNITPQHRETINSALKQALITLLPQDARPKESDLAAAQEEITQLIGEIVDDMLPQETEGSPSPAQTIQQFGQPKQATPGASPSPQRAASAQPQQQSPTSTTEPSDTEIPQTEGPPTSFQQGEGIAGAGMPLTKKMDAAPKPATDEEIDKERGENKREGKEPAAIDKKQQVDDGKLVPEKEGSQTGFVGQLNKARKQARTQKKADKQAEKSKKEEANVFRGFTFFLFIFAMRDLTFCISQIFVIIGPVLFNVIIQPIITLITLVFLHIQRKPKKEFIFEKAIKNPKLLGILFVASHTITLLYLRLSYTRSKQAKKEKKKIKKKSKKKIKK
ncbi:hypothetical protein KKG22_00720 [Patescibacteria group bacterium]|nr:hypothetical protein [Patescibacteria group bacterium]MBU1721915.1 hypothetical protein [Patescibacteria group bacterium]MBU1901208.1 hypothetical protein [Patescibacteria group bacterium]